MGDNIIWFTCKFCHKKYKAFVSPEKKIKKGEIICGECAEYLKYSVHKLLCFIIGITAGISVYLLFGKSLVVGFVLSLILLGFAIFLISFIFFIKRKSRNKAYSTDELDELKNS